MNFSIHMNDPAVPAIKSVDLLLLPSSPSFSVHGLTEDNMDLQSAGIHIFISHTLEFVQKYLNAPLTNWSSVQNLTAYPKAGFQLNAYYDRSCLRFFYHKHPITKKTIFLCESSDVVCHELGHAILDALRPDLWNNPNIEVMAFHESFGDCISILSTLNHPEMIDYCLQETQGDLRKPNAVASIAEEMGNALYYMSKNTGRSPEYLRNAINDFSYVNPKDIPNTGPDNILTRSSHNFSRIFTGAFYDSLVGLYEQYSLDCDPKSALVLARDRMGRVLFDAVKRAPVSPFFFESMAKTMLQFDEGAIFKAFSRRKILGIEEIPFLFGGQTVEAKPTVVKLSDYLEGDNPLYDIEIEICQPIKYMCGKVDHLTIQAAKVALDHLAAADKVGYTSDKEFRVEDGKLIRNHFSCH